MGWKALETEVEFELQIKLVGGRVFNWGTSGDSL